MTRRLNDNNEDDNDAILLLEHADKHRQPTVLALSRYYTICKPRWNSRQLLRSVTHERYLYNVKIVY